MAEKNVFSNPMATPAMIEDYLIKGSHKLKWMGKDRLDRPIVCRAQIKISYLRQVMSAVKQIMLINGLDPTFISVFYDLIDLEKKMVHRRKQKQKLTVAEVFLRKTTLDSYLK